MLDEEVSHISNSYSSNVLYSLFLFTVPASRRLLTSSMHIVCATAEVGMIYSPNGISMQGSSIAG
jgi:hypothetical protein